ncbi:PIG-L family deacetylase [Skermanella mucosa]|uniref:PIG-L deacetylase family protein n=1 Tax=Skermanella mucosa TaxID=1789672 RepID=UPI00192AA9A6|nr:PIG-L family deacetylase [Skermanella mucosa]UEM22078.1 PIG-L family deacetylase [Skermanella mucosa]
MPSRTALFISPHLDDVAFSCGGTLAMLKAAGWRTVLATVFTRSVPDPSGFALACQTDKGLAPKVDYMAVRREEDAAFGRTLEVDEVHWLDLAEAPHRGYGSAAELFSVIRPGDEIWREAAHRIGTLAGRVGPDLMFGCQAIGNHVDHRQTVRAMVELGRPVAWYRDLPYVIRAPEEAPPPGLPGGLVPLAIPVSDHLPAKVAGACRYATQLPFQFGGADRVGPALTAFAADEARRAGGSGYAERFLIDPLAAKSVSSA